MRSSVHVTQFVLKYLQIHLLANEEAILLPEYSINMKIDDEDFNRLMSGYRAAPQRKKNTITSLKKLSERSGKGIFHITYNDAQIFYASCISDINNGTYKPIYVKSMIALLKAFYEHLFTLSKTSEINADFPCCSHGNPFSYVTVKIPDKLEYYDEDFPSLESIDSLLSFCPTLSLKTAVCLAFKMCLTVSEISDLKKKQIVYDNEKMYIRLASSNELGEYPRYLTVPEDIRPMIKQLHSSTSIDYEYLLISKRRSQYAVRSLEHALKKTAEENNLSSNLTFLSSRNMGIRILLSNGASPQDVADYLGIQGKWLSRYEKVPLHLVKDMGKFSNIKIL